MSFIAYSTRLALDVCWPRGRKHDGRVKRRRRSSPGVLERLEDRTLFSLGLAHPTHVPIASRPGVTALNAVSGYTPAQVRHAYGFDQVAFGGIPGDGKGVT